MAERFGLFGHPVRHSLSPVIHQASFRALGLDATYECFDVPPESLGDALEMCRVEGFKGINLTVPHKVAAVPFMNRLDRYAELFGAVNTVRFEPDGSMSGFNTDGIGFCRDLEIVGGVTPATRRVLILGCGGAGRALAISCAMHGAEEVILLNRTEEKAEAVAREISAACPECRTRVVPFSAEEWIDAAQQADIIVQCTTTGLNPEDVSVLPAEAFHKGQVFYDIVYVLPVTPTMAAAASAGCKVINGAGMLVRQGAESFRIWTGREPDENAMLEALRQILEKRR
ncbi:MAG: shikimate dehydrogenase [Kiritimatiellae bacterium]|nr:shikimate dehydrogenase [Kiritimatiellia bacterium]